jgi:hypothetical protein
MLEESVGYTVFDGGAALSTDPMLVEVGLRNLERYCVHAELERTEASTGGVAEELGSEQVVEGGGVLCAEDEGVDSLHRTSQPPPDSIPPATPPPLSSPAAATGGGDPPAIPRVLRPRPAGMPLRP